MYSWSLSIIVNWFWVSFWALMTELCSSNSLLYSCIPVMQGCFSFQLRNERQTIKVSNTEYMVSGCYSVHICSSCQMHNPNYHNPVTCTCTYIHVCINIHPCPPTYKHIHVYNIYGCLHSYIYDYLHLCRFMDMCAYTHTYLHSFPLTMTWLDVDFPR